MMNPWAIECEKRNGVRAVGPWRNTEDEARGDARNAARTDYPTLIETFIEALRDVCDACAPGEGNRQCIACGSNHGDLSNVADGDPSCHVSIALRLLAGQKRSTDYPISEAVALLVRTSDETDRKYRAGNDDRLTDYARGRVDGLLEASHILKRATQKRSDGT